MARLLLFLVQLAHHLFVSSSQNGHVCLLEQANEIDLLAFEDGGDKLVERNRVDLEVGTVGYHRVVANVFMWRIQLVTSRLHRYPLNFDPLLLFLLLLALLIRILL
jgi:hypothetical protein